MTYLLLIEYLQLKLDSWAVRLWPPGCSLALRGTQRQLQFNYWYIWCMWYDATTQALLYTAIIETKAFTSAGVMWRQRVTTNKGYRMGRWAAEPSRRRPRSSFPVHAHLNSPIFRLHPSAFLLEFHCVQGSPARPAVRSPAPLSFLAELRHPLESGRGRESMKDRGTRRQVLQAAS